MKVAPVESGCPHQSQGGSVVAQGRSGAELADRIQDRGAKCFGSTGRSGEEKMLDSFQAEFSGGFVAVGATFDHSARNQQQRGTLRQADSWRFRSGVGKQSQREAGRTELDDSRPVTEKPGRMPGIAITQSTESLVVTRDERRAGMDAAGGFDDDAIDAMRKLRHGVGFVEIEARKEFPACIAKDFLCGGEKAPRIFAASGDVEQTE